MPLEPVPQFGRHSIVINTVVKMCFDTFDSFSRFGQKITLQPITNSHANRNVSKAQSASADSGSLSLVHRDHQRPNVYPPNQDSRIAAAFQRHRHAPVPRLRHCWLRHFSVVFQQTKHEGCKFSSYYYCSHKHAHAKEGQGRKQKKHGGILKKQVVLASGFTVHGAAPAY